MADADPFLSTERRRNVEGPFLGEEVQLANRNSGILLEALRYDVTPVGMHYLLNHFDVPYVADSNWQVELAGSVARPSAVPLEEIKALPARTLPVTLECAGNGRGTMQPRYPSMPWLSEAVGTAEWTGTPLRHVLERAGLREDAVEIAFIGADRGFDSGHEHAFGRSLKRDAALSDDVLLVWAMNGATPAAPARLSSAPDRARLVRHGERQVARSASRRWTNPTTATSRPSAITIAPSRRARARPSPTCG